MRFHNDLPTVERELLIKAEELLLRRLRRADDRVISDPSVAGELFRMRLAAHDREIFTVMFVDSRHRPLAIEDLHAGDVSSCEVMPREVVRRALLLNASAIVLAHVHPSGSLEPSSQDRSLTQQIKAAAALVNIRLLDHFVVAASGYTSMASRGWV